MSLPTLLAARESTVGIARSSHMLFTPYISVGRMIDQQITLARAAAACHYNVFATISLLSKLEVVANSLLGWLMIDADFRVPHFTIPYLK